MRTPQHDQLGHRDSGLQLRRVFFLLPHDRIAQPHGLYQEGVPGDAVTPRQCGPAAARGLAGAQRLRADQYQVADEPYRMVLSWSGDSARTWSASSTGPADRPNGPSWTRGSAVTSDV
uniref:DUF6009 family protein n=1 Tax=Streptomyces sp. NBC_00003 TaxID=2903608 RepID=A0AAU2UW49_9ACTN